MTEFVLAENDRYWWPITVRLPDPANAGKILVQHFEMEFEPQDRDEVLKQSMILDGLTDPQERVEHEHAQLRAVCKNWRKGPIDRNKQQLPFTEENFNAALQKSWFRIAVYTGLNESQMGKEARLGN